MRAPALIATALVLALGSVPVGAQDACPGLFADGRMPVLTNPKLAVRATPLCFEAFAVLHSGVTRTPLYAAEHLTRASIAAARAVARDDSFHEEARLPEDQRAGLEDYVRSGFDRGHLAPAGDMPTASAQAESFSLANITPQNRVLNRGLWADIEEGTRRLTSRRGALFVVTGVIFSGDAVQQIKGGVLVPTHLFKALYDPASGEAGAYLARNDDSKDWRVLSIDDLRRESGIDVFPGLPQAARATAMSLPDPQASARADERRPRHEQTWQEWLERELARAARKFLRDLLRSFF
ncbi:MULTISPECIES: DNA/RNA non-specific endonuclease [unclassified Methylobacterium]|uniref:DNA/RNA non-specific endonuclease n=1 Tax=unclassified Methylobacterium TaxID=2615210 RepID=UPI0008EA2EC3|nr:MULTISPECIES: DNA/RNA non-specific endonuclease [unclassified Methylobacterium]SFV14796.1 endonuclease G [Methylobacterium sp. UNCCL125]